MAKTSSAKQQKTTSSLVNTYLIAYNVFCWLGWNYVLVEVLRDLYESGGDYTRVFARVGITLTWVQTVAVLEILHTIVGFVRSPVMTTAIQVFTRVMLVWGICDVFKIPEVHQHPAFTTMTLAWCITESVRYGYYWMNLIGLQPSWLLWARYTFFFVLYPVGASSEAVLIYQSLGTAKARYPMYYYYLVALLCTYPPGFIQMYFHMISQRKKYLKAEKKGKKA